MTCPECGSDQLAFVVPADLRGLLPEDPERVAVCTRCLAVEPTADAPDELPDFRAVSDALPTGEGGAAMALALGLLDSLALYRSEIGALLERVERAGADPLLVVDRLADDPDVALHFDVARRRRQVEQLVYE